MKTLQASKTLLGLDQESLQLVKSKEFAVIQQFGVATSEECRTLEQQFAQLNWGHYKAAPDIPILGPAVYDNSSDLKTYFENAKKMTEVLHKVVPMRTVLVERILSLLKEANQSKVKVAFQASENANYFLGLGRFIRSVGYHTDFVPRDLSFEWDIARNVRTQLAMNLFISDVREGGECEVFNRTWKPEHENYLDNESYGYLANVVEGYTEKQSIKPIQGSLAIFPCEYYHRVLPSKAKTRITLSFFMGTLEDGSLIVWA